VSYIPAALRRLVEERANYQCEYRLHPANVAFFPYKVDHVIAQKHGGKTEADNWLTDKSGKHKAQVQCK
jgi:5-methylcytosine-specific restriction endonuclease McrA